MLIDTHAHINFNAFKDDGGEVIKRTLAQNIWMINVGSQFDTSKRAVEYAQKYPNGVFAAVGLHPIHLEETEIDEEEIHFKTRKEEFNPVNYRVLARQPRVVALGETGLDYYRIRGEEGKENKGEERKAKEKQRRVFIEHIDLAEELRLPLILHCRGSKENPNDAYLEILEILSLKKAKRGVIHCFSANLEIAQKFIDLGFYIGFTGIITFEKTTKLQEVVRDLPMEKILIETDCPYLAPEPYRGKRNEPLYVEFVARKIAEIKKINFEEVAEMTTRNARELFKI